VNFTLIRCVYSVMEYYSYFSRKTKKWTWKLKLCKFVDEVLVCWRYMVVLARQKRQTLDWNEASFIDVTRSNVNLNAFLPCSGIKFSFLFTCSIFFVQTFYSCNYTHIILSFHFFFKFLVFYTCFIFYNNLFILFYI
jgi:hypothetical protein